MIVVEGWRVRRVNGVLRSVPIEEKPEKKLQDEWGRDPDPAGVPVFMRLNTPPRGMFHKIRVLLFGGR
jgi:hypothetical protein